MTALERIRLYTAPILKYEGYSPLKNSLYHFLTSLLYAESADYFL